MLIRVVKEAKILYPVFGLPDNPDKIIQRIHDELFARVLSTENKETLTKEWFEEIIMRHIEDWGGWKWKDEIIKKTMPDQFL